MTPWPNAQVLLQLFTHCRAHQMYYLFGFILVAYLVLCITSAEVAILLTYFQMCGEVRMGPILLL